MSSPAVDLRSLGLAPPLVKPKAPLPTVPLVDVLARSHAVLMSVEQKQKLRTEFAEAKKRYEQELALAEEHGYLNGKTRIPRRIPIKREVRRKVSY